MSQEKLAQKFGVSFATFNSWINGKSRPRKKALEKIESLYLDYTGQKIIPREQLVEIIGTPFEDTISHIAEVHSRFELIHPFSDGNGRIGRLLIHAMALGKNLPPAVIRQERKQFYYTCLNKAQTSRHEDLSLLEDFICDGLMAGFDILARSMD
ncbi:MAG: helix-turn-helix domain-containing protein [bacterium]|nr:helix-turn-helix domain-containing protein [bacterium]